MQDCIRGETSYLLHTPCTEIFSVRARPAWKPEVDTSTVSMKYGNLTSGEEWTINSRRMQVSCAIKPPVAAAVTRNSTGGTFSMWRNTSNTEARILHAVHLDSVNNRPIYITNLYNSFLPDSWGSSVNSDYTTVWSALVGQPAAAKSFIFFPLGPTSLQFKGKMVRAWRWPITQIHLMSRFTYGAKPPSRYTSSRRGAWLNTGTLSYP